MANDYFNKPYEAPRNISDAVKLGQAAEHSAHHLGRISKALERIADALEKKNNSATDGGTF